MNIQALHICGDIQFWSCSVATTIPLPPLIHIMTSSGNVRQIHNIRDFGWKYHCRGLCDFRKSKRTDALRQHRRRDNLYRHLCCSFYKITVLWRRNMYLLHCRVAEFRFLDSHLVSGKARVVQSNKIVSWDEIWQKQSVNIRSMFRASIVNTKLYFVRVR